MTKLQVREISSLDLDLEFETEWNNFVRNSPQGSVFSTTDYLTALDIPFSILIVRKSERIVAGMILSRSILGTYSTPLYTKYLGLLLEPSPTKRKSAHTAHLIRLADPVAQHCKKYQGFEFFFHPAFDYWSPFYWHGFRQQTSYTYVLPVSEAETWMSNAENITRRQYAHGQRAGLIFGKCSTNDEKVLSALYEVNMAPYISRGNKPLMTLGKFKKFVHALRTSGALDLYFVKSEDDQFLASAVVVTDQRSGYLLINGTSVDAPNFANRFLVCKIINTIHEAGLDFDFEGSMIRPIARFYKDFNPTLVPYSRIWKPDAFWFVKSNAVSLAKRILGYNR